MGDKVVVLARRVADLSDQLTEARDKLAAALNGSVKPKQARRPRKIKASQVVSDGPIGIDLGDGKSVTGEIRQRRTRSDKGKPRKAKPGSMAEEFADSIDSEPET